MNRAAWTRWGVAYLVALALAALAAILTPLDLGGALFLGGALCILASITFIRLGGPKAIVRRSADGSPEWDLDHDKRRIELARGWAIFLMGLGLWGAMGLVWAVWG